ncbi:PREDICTED: LOW QUALITY PROTEIN: disease resistance protein RML1B-like [Brassica oleracea var. oleracea]|uniref:LOW QUALITY PROTEIN: disease resistance protein RML1B-like n=1 Tax=Brassica oleracea var. oleracea TaxID=109376 RepID=UPI0006A7418B|nr:PREDICTED: LOW QUALITY PROTEIN: disease resistance protein RML1B-like [Brassica oleracea var. oleracea]
MASLTSSLSTRNWSYNVFASFHGPDVRKTLLSHMREQFNVNGITMYNDQKMVRSEEIAPSLTNGIRESRIAIVILSKKYALSSWCLDELVEILECKKSMGQIVMTIFYGVEPSDVRKQTGEFGIAFEDTCEHKTKEAKQKWIKALTNVSNIAGEDFLRWANEADMIKQIARDVSDKLNATPSRDFDGMLGLEPHIRELKSLLNLDDNGVMMVAITGPAGIGKTTIARALQNQISNRFQLTCFVDNLRENNHSGFDEHGWKLRLQEQFLSNLLNLGRIRIGHSGVIEERLSKHRVLIILDDVYHIKQLEALANKTTWFGSGSRIIITTENKEILQQHGIKNMYRVGLPSDEQALKILCRYAFGNNSHNQGFEKLVPRVTKLCDNLPLGLSVVGSSLRGKEADEWEEVLSRLETNLDRDSGTILDRDIEDVLRVGYESLDENEQTLFLHIAVFFNYKSWNLVNTMFDDSDLDVKHGLKILVNRSLIIQTIGYEHRIVMHRLLEQMGKKAIQKQDPWKRRILMNAREICDVLQHAKGTWNVLGISFDISRINELSISKKAFKRMTDLRFLKIYKRQYDGNDRMHIPEEIQFPCGLRLLDWEAYPSKSLPPTFNPQYLVELSMKNSKLEKLWEGIKQLANLQKVDFSGSVHLKELPDLSNASSLEKLDLIGCESLVEIPSSCSNLHKLQKLWVSGCINLQVIPARMNLASLDEVFMRGCSRLKNIPVMSTNIRKLCISETAVEDVPASTKLWTRLTSLSINKGGKLKRLTYLPKNVTDLDLSYSDIQKISDSIKALHQLRNLNLAGCTRLASLPKLPGSVKTIIAEDCESLETVSSSLNNPNARLNFINCFKLSQQARRAIFKQSFFTGGALLPGTEVPEEFDHRGRGTSLTIRPDGNPYSGFVVCVVISPKQQEFSFSQLKCRRIGVAQDDFYPVEMLVYVGEVHKFRREHLFVFDSRFLEFYPSDMSREIVLELSSNSNDFNIIDCGARILTDENGSNECGLDDQVLEEETELESSEAFEDSIEHSNEAACYTEEGDNLDGGKCTDCWSWLLLCFDLSHLLRFVSGRRR